MNLKSLFDEDRAVSPVIGVILMVAITVILAAVIGTFVLGLGDRVSTSTPSAQFSFEYEDAETLGNDTLEISHNGGDSIDAGALTITSTAFYNNTGTTAPNSTTSATWANITDSSADSKVSAGSTATIVAANGRSIDAATIRVVWEAESGDSSAVLATWTGPDA